MSFAFVFPGQGSQSVGMLGALAAADPGVEATFAEASAVLGYDLWQLVGSGPAQRLNATEFTQPAMLAAGVAVWRAWCRRGGGEPARLSGHSLGEFTALVCAGSIEFAAAVALVSFRGRVMNEAVPEGEGAMAAILGLSGAQVEQACREAAQDAVVEPVNFNAPGQIVIAGARAAVQRAVAAATQHGARRAVVLPISAPCHSRLMQPAAVRLGERLQSVELAAPRIEYVSAVDAAIHSDPEDIRALLVRQLASPVQWIRTVRALAAGGITQLIECGPGKVLTGLNRRIERGGGLTALSIEDVETIDAARAATEA